MHICIGFSCNNNCIFCMEEDREARRRFVMNQSREDIRRMIFDSRGVREVLFTSGEG
ncbi:MAG: hypothetical protein FJ088_10260, partial [Deltaproteobacteria bacterium]|nr:hypothetical protein [Deltaproteobacteria bacterium]